MGGGCVAAAVLQRNATAIANDSGITTRFHSILSLLCREQKRTIHPVKHWEIIADNLSKAGFSWGCASAVDCEDPESYSDDS